MEAWQLWTIIGFLLLIIEIFTPGFVLGSFGLGAFGGGLAAYWGYSLSVQLIVFSIITLAIFFGIRPLYLKYLKRFEADHKTGVRRSSENNTKLPRPSAILRTPVGLRLAGKAGGRAPKPVELSKQEKW